MTPERLRQRAMLCLKFAEAANDEDVATKLKMMAGDYLMEAERAEGTPGFAPTESDKDTPEPEPQPA